MSAYVLGQLFKEIKYAPFAMFSIQFDESTDIAKLFTITRGISIMAVLKMSFFMQTS